MQSDINPTDGLPSSPDLDGVAEKEHSAEETAKLTRAVDRPRETSGKVAMTASADLPPIYFDACDM